MSASGEREGLRRVTKDDIGGANPVWSPDGKSIVFAAARDEHFYSRGFYSISAAGGGQPQRITPADDARNSWATFFPDGSRIAYVSDRSGFLNIWTMTPDGSDQRQLTREQQDQDYPENDYIQTMGLRWSPDGKRLLYFTNRARQPRPEDCRARERRGEGRRGQGRLASSGRLGRRSHGRVRLRELPHSAGAVREAARRQREAADVFEPRRLPSRALRAAGVGDVEERRRRERSRLPAPAVVGEQRRALAGAGVEPHLQRRAVLQPVEPDLQLHRAVRLRDAEGQSSRLERLRHEVPRPAEGQLGLRAAEGHRVRLPATCARYPTSTRSASACSATAWAAT